MKIFYVSSLMSKAKMHNIFSKANNKPLQSVQKYHRLMCEGLSMNELDVETISSIPMSRKIMNKLIWYDKFEIEKEIKFNYIPFINIPILRQITTLICEFFMIFFKIMRHKKNNFIICDILNTTISVVALFCGKLFNVKCIALVTDLPRDINSKKISSEINQFFQSKYDAYILLTEYMNKEVNPKNRPYIVIEGFADINFNTSIAKNPKESKFCIYAGGIYEKYGVKMLAEAFDKIEDKNIEMRFYGSGDYIEELKKIKSKNVKYMGVLANNLMLIEEQKALLLINPRFSSEEYTKYSFPSKIIEYMTTGTAVLTTKLKGIPEQYFDYLYTFDKENIEGFAYTLNNIFKNDSKIQKMGEMAKEFVIDHKNNFIQTQKLKQFLVENFIAKER